MNSDSNYHNDNTFPVSLSVLRANKVLQLGGPLSEWLKNRQESSQ